MTGYRQRLLTGLGAAALGVIGIALIGALDTAPTAGVIVGYVCFGVLLVIGLTILIVAVRAKRGEGSIS